MNRDRRKVDLCSVQAATTHSFEYVKHCKLVAEDPDLEYRLVVAQCQACHYSRRIGGAMSTSAPCAFCDTVLHSNNTCLDVLCEPCARKWRLCKRCGGDLHLKRRNKLELKGMKSNAESIPDSGGEGTPESS